MSDCIDNDLEFHGTKKGGTRKTVSKRKAYVNTPSQRKKAVQLLNTALQRIVNENLGSRPFTDLIINARDLLR